MNKKKEFSNKTFHLKTDPLVKFLIVSIGIYVAYGFYGQRDEDALAKDNTITVTANEIDIMAFGWQQRYNKAPTQEELDKLIATRVKETVLYTEAIKMGLDKDDVVIKRRVVLQFRNFIEGLIVPEEPTEVELKEFFAENSEQYLSEESLSIIQVFFDPDKREESTLIDAERALVKLKNLEALPSDLSKYGDQFMLASEYNDITPMELRKYFGRGFTNSVMALETKEWVGPVLSGYGTHLVYVSKKVSQIPPSLEDIKEEVIADYIEVEKQELKKIFIDSLIQKYTIIIEDEATTNK
jgi:peptidyl-prolyl cis-trans isomerase C